MTDNYPSAADIEREANRLRREIGSTTAALSENLRPSNLKAEVSDALHLREMTPQRLLQTGAASHPVAIVVGGVVAGYLLQIALKRRRGMTIEHDGSPSPSAYQPKIFARLLDAVEGVASDGIEKVRQHASSLSDDLSSEANEQISTASAHVSRTVHDSLDTLLRQVPASSNAKPLVSALAKLALAYVLRAGASAEMKNSR